MRFYIKVLKVGGETFYHNRGRLTRNSPSFFKSIDSAIRVARKKYSPKLGYSLRSWEVGELKVNGKEIREVYPAISIHRPTSSGEVI